MLEMDEEKTQIKKIEVDSYGKPSRNDIKG